MMPKIVDAFNNWRENITLLLISQTTNGDGITSQTETPITFRGTIQPLKPQNLEVSAEGQRAWRWWQIHTSYELHRVVSTNDRIKLSDGKKYKLMLDNDYSRNNYLEYHLIEDYQNA